MACPQHNILILYRTVQLSKHFPGIISLHHPGNTHLQVLLTSIWRFFKTQQLKSLNELSEVTQQVHKLKPSLKVKSSASEKCISPWLIYIQLENSQCINYSRK